MPIMTRMRDSMPVILFGLLIAFLITIIFEWGMDYLGMRGGPQDTVGKVNGKRITYREFSDLLKSVTDNQKTQGNADIDETQMKQARDQVWQTLITQELVGEQIKRLGITVTDQELVDWVRGENPPEDLKRNFIDSTGKFRRDLYDEFLSNPNQFLRDPRGNDSQYGTRWLAEYENSLRQRRLQEKLQSLLMATVRVSDGEVRQAYVDETERNDALYAFFDPETLVSDSTVQVTDADLKAYYDENIDQFKFESTRTLSYVTFPVKPSAADSAGRQKDMDDAVSKAKSGSDFLQLVYTYSDKPDSGAYFHRGELEPEIDRQVFAAAPGSLVGPISDAQGLHLFKVLGDRHSDKVYIRASHILFPLNGQADTNEVKALAQKVAREAKSGKDFAELAREYSKDPGSARNGGDLGWFTKGRMVPAFEAAAFRTNVGEVTGPIRSPLGLHIIKVFDKDTREVHVANILMKIDASSQTKNDIEDRAKDFSYNAKGNDFTKEAKLTGLQPTQAVIQEHGRVIPGIGVNDAVVRWAFKNKVGAVSAPFSITNGWAVFAVAEAKDAGVRPFDEVKASLRPVVLRKKKIDAAMSIAADLRSKLGPTDSLTKLVTLQPAIRVQNTGAIAPDGSVPGVGRDPSFIGAVTGLHVGEISPPVRGNRGAYLIQLVSRSPFDSTAFASQKPSIEARLLQEKKSQFMSSWMEQLRAGADIQDNRDLFFQ